jgi:hypothetical protein
VPCTAAALDDAPHCAPRRAQHRSQRDSAEPRRGTSPQLEHGSSPPRIPPSPRPAHPALRPQPSCLGMAPQGHADSPPPPIRTIAAIGAGPRVSQQQHSLSTMDSRWRPAKREARRGGAWVYDKNPGECVVAFDDSVSARSRDETEGSTASLMYAVMRASLPKVSHRPHRRAGCAFTVPKLHRAGLRGVPWLPFPHQPLLSATRRGPIVPLRLPSPPQPPSCAALLRARGVDAPHSVDHLDDAQT